MSPARRNSRRRPKVVSLLLGATPRQYPGLICSSPARCRPELRPAGSRPDAHRASGDDRLASGVAHLRCFPSEPGRHYTDVVPRDLAETPLAPLDQATGPAGRERSPALTWLREAATGSARGGAPCCADIYASPSLSEPRRSHNPARRGRRVGGPAFQPETAASIGLVRSFCATLSLTASTCQGSASQVHNRSLVRSSADAGSGAQRAAAAADAVGRQHAHGAERGHGSGTTATRRIAAAGSA